MSRVPAHKRLQEIPDVFTTNTLTAMLGGDGKAASVYINRWRKEGLISSLGPRAGVHFNLVRNPSAQEDMWLDAVHHILPGAVIAGVSAVHAAGWTTQIPACVEIMIPPRQTVPEITGVVVRTRPQIWFQGAKIKPQRQGAIPTVNPAFALADLWHSNEWRPDADDLEFDLIEPDKLEQAFKRFRLQIPEEWSSEFEMDSYRM